MSVSDRQRESIELLIADVVLPDNNACVPGGGDEA
jgi:hypothetical protein